MKIIAERNPRDLKAEARRLLASTDWLVIRHAETGKPIPSDIAAARAAARDTLSTD